MASTHYLWGSAVSFAASHTWTAEAVTLWLA